MKKLLTLNDLPVVSRFAIPVDRLQEYLQFAVVGGVQFIGVNNEDEFTYMNRHNDFFYSKVKLEKEF